jgi:hypothetical protein
MSSVGVFFVASHHDAFPGLTLPEYEIEDKQ